MGLKKQYIHFKNWVAVTAKKAYLEIKRDILLIVFGFVSTIANAQATGAIHTAAEDIQKYRIYKNTKSLCKSSCMPLLPLLELSEHFRYTSRCVRPLMDMC